MTEPTPELAFGAITAYGRMMRALKKSFSRLVWLMLGAVVWGAGACDGGAGAKGAADTFVAADSQPATDTEPADALLSDTGPPADATGCQSDAACDDGDGGDGSLDDGDGGDGSLDDGDGGDGGDGSLDASPAPSDLNVTTELAQTEAAAGTRVTVSCLVTDDADTAVTVPTWVDSDLPLYGSALEATTEGSHAVTCRLVAGDDAADHVPADLLVTPGPAATLAVSLDPDRAAFQPGAEVTVGWSAVDAYGNVTTVAAEDVSIAVTPPEAATAVDADTFVLGDAGAVTFTVETTGQVSGSRAVVIDGWEPLLEVDWPEIGGMMGGSVDVAVYGRAADTSGIAEVLVDGQPATLTGDGTFTTTVSPVQGLNVTHIEGIDTAGNSVERTIPWLWSPTWYPLQDAGELTAQVPGGWVYLGPDFVGASSSTAEGVDMATALLAMPVDTPVSLGSEAVEVSLVYENANTCNAIKYWTATLTDASLAADIVRVDFPDDVAATLDAQGDHLELVWSGQVEALAAVTVHTAYSYDRVKAACGTCTCSNGSKVTVSDFESVHEFPITADLSLTASFTPGSSPLLAVTVTATASGVDRDLAGLQSRSYTLGEVTYNLVSSKTETFADTLADIDADLPSALATWLDTAALADAIEAAVEASFDARGAALEDLLVGTGQGWTAPAPVDGPGSALTGLTEVSEVQVTDGGLRIDLLGALAPDDGVYGALLSPASIGRANCLAAAGAPSVTGIDDVAYGIPVDLLNQALYATWASRPQSRQVRASTLAALQDLAPDGTTVARAWLAERVAPILTDCPTGSLEAQTPATDVILELVTDDGTFLTSTLVAGSASVDLRVDFLLQTTASDPLWALVETAPVPDAAALEDLADDLAEEAVWREVFVAGLTSTLGDIPALVVPLDLVAPDTSPVRPTGPATLDAGVLVIQNDCTDEACTIDERGCTEDGHMGACVAFSDTCARFVTTSYCPASTPVCGEYGEPLCLLPETWISEPGATHEADGSVSDDLVVADACQPDSIRVLVDYETDYRYYSNVQVTGPTGATARLEVRGGGAEYGHGPLIGTFPPRTPTDSLDVFAEVEAQGTWTLTISNYYSGELRSWGLELVGCD